MDCLPRQQKYFTIKAGLTALEISVIVKKSANFCLDVIDHMQ